MNDQRHGFARHLFYPDRMLSVVICRCGEHCCGFTDRLATAVFRAHISASRLADVQVSA